MNLFDIPELSDKKVVQRYDNDSVWICSSPADEKYVIRVADCELSKKISNLGKMGLPVEKTVDILRYGDDSCILVTEFVPGKNYTQIITEILNGIPKDINKIEELGETYSKYYEKGFILEGATLSNFRYGDIGPIRVGIKKITEYPSAWDNSDKKFIEACFNDIVEGFLEPLGRLRAIKKGSRLDMSSKTIRVLSGPELEIAIKKSDASSSVQDRNQSRVEKYAEDILESFIQGYKLAESAPEETIEKMIREEWKRITSL
ncbi:MAG: hypothetical protein ABIG84_01265 [archaeon]